MKMLNWLAATVLGISSLTHAQYKGKYVGWSTGYIFVGSVNSVYWKAFTHLANFQVTVNSSGGLGTGNLAVANSAFVSACHQHGVKALVCIGGQGQSRNFSGATSKPSSQTALVNNIIDLVKTGGYDGVDMDWEAGEEGDGAAMVTRFKSLHQELRDAINKMDPRPMMTAAVATDWYPHCTAAIAPFVDQLNNMSYYDRVTKMDALFKPVLDLGVAKNIQGVGFGFDSDGEVKDVSDIAAKCRYSIDNGYGGIMVWDVTHAPTATMDTVARYVSLDHQATAIAPAPMLSASNSRLFLKNGADDISFSVPQADQGVYVELGVYDVRGNLVKSLVRGYRAPGLHSVSWNRGSKAGESVRPGTYFIRLWTNSTVETAKAVITQ